MRTAIVCAVVAACLVPGARSPARAADDTPQTQAISFLADVTLIDSKCPNLNASFGMAFTYAEARGVHAVDVMPLGRDRKQFQAAYDARLAATSRDELCGSLADAYNQSLPGLFTAR